jgi:hypothetical protein
MLTYKTTSCTKDWLHPQNIHRSHVVLQPGLEEWQMGSCPTSLPQEDDSILFWKGDVAVHSYVILPL